MRRRHFFPLLAAACAAAAAAALLPGCGGDNTYNPALTGDGGGGDGPTFLLAVSPATRTVAPGQPASYTATLTAANGFDSAVGLSVSGLPEGAGAQFAPASVTPAGGGGASSTLTVTTEADVVLAATAAAAGAAARAAGRATPEGSYTLTVTGTGGGVTRQAQVTLVVEEGVAVAVSPPAPTLPVGGQQAFTATVTGDANTAVTWSVRPGGAGGTITDAGVYTAPAVPGTDTVVATSVADPAREGTATVTVQAGNLVGEIR